MKYIKFLIITMLFIFMCGCNNTNESLTLPDYPIIDAPDRTESETADGYRSIKEVTSDTAETQTMYYANKESKKIHLPSCHYAMKMSETKIRIENDKSVLLSEGYTECGVCKP